jgi:hypothetical protein
MCCMKSASARAIDVTAAGYFSARPEGAAGAQRSSPGRRSWPSRCWPTSAPCWPEQMASSPHSSAALPLRSAPAVAGRRRSTTSNRPCGLSSMVAWLLFGALAVPTLTTSLSWQVVAYAVLSLTIIRMVPVALCLLGSRMTGPRSIRRLVRTPWTRLGGVRVDHPRGAA